MNSLDKIKQYMSEGDFRKAIKELDLIISKEPNNAIAFYMRGKSAFIEIQNEKYDNSLEATKSLIYSTIEHDLNKSIEIDPNIIDAYRGLMYLNRVVRNADKEREFAQILLEKSKETSIDALLILASSYLNNGKDESDFHQAIGFYDDFIKRVDIEDSKMARFERGLCYYNLDILNKADAEANKLIQDFPMYDDAYFLKGIALSKNSINSDFFEDAIFFLNRAVELNNKNYNALYEIAEWHFEKENYIDYRIIVEYNGIGMSKEYLPHIFEEFSREHTSTESKVTGTGLGLPIVKSLIDMMGGTIEVESQLGCGTKMTVVLPFEIASEKQILEEKQKEKEKISDSILGKRVLLAEDNELNAEIAMTVLKENGLKAERAANGKQCIEMLKKMPEDYYDMILMDIQMPEMDGYEATKLIRNLDDARADIPIVAMTANAFEEDRQKALENGMNAHVSKPVDMNMLFKVMTQILKK